MTDKKDSILIREAMEDDPEDFYAWHLERAKQGHVSDAQELLHGFCTFFETNKPLPHVIAEHLYLAFARYLRGDCEIDKALMLRRGKGRKRGSVTVNPVAVVAALYLKVKRDGLGKEEAKEQVVAEYFVSKRNLETYDREWNLIRNFPIAELEQLIEDAKSMKD